MQRWYFFYISTENKPSEMPNYKGKRDLRAYFSFWLQKCQRSKKMPSEEVSLRKIFTK